MNLLKKLFQPLYKKTITRLAIGLKTVNNNELLLSLNHRMFLLEKHVQNLFSIISETNAHLSPVRTADNPLFMKYSFATLVNRDIAATLQPGKRNDSEEMMFFENLPESYIKDKAVCSLYGGTRLFQHILEKKGAKKILQIESRVKDTPLEKSESLIFAYPLDIDKIGLPTFNTILVPNSSMSSVLIMHNLLDLGKLTKDALILKVRVNHSSSFSSDIEPEIEEYNSILVFNDNYVRSQLHRNGFVEVRCLYTIGKGIDPLFDKKISQLDYKNGYRIVRKNKPLSSSASTKKLDSYVNKIYIAYKLPQKISA